MAAPQRPKTRATKLADILRPESLRNQWLLTEILAKPVGLREEPASRR